VLKEKPMRKIVVLCVVSVLAACGSDSTPAPTTVTGSVAGSAFVQRDQAAFLGAGNGCSLSLSPVPVGVSIAVAELTDYTGTCADATRCSLKASSMAVTLIIARASPAGTAPGFKPGRPYQFIDLATIGTTPPTITPDAELNIPVFTAIVSTIGAAPTCTPANVIPATTGSSLTVTGSSSTSISGTVTLVLAGGAGTLTGGFSASTCAGVPAFDACAALDGILGGTGGGLPDPCNGSTPTCN
jgi:hypothetical protein